MMYPYMTLNDDTEITHSQIIQKDVQERVKVYIETPVFWGDFTLLHVGFQSKNGRILRDILIQKWRNLGNW